MPKPKTTEPTKLQYLDPNIEHLLYVNKAIGVFLKQAHALLDQHEFPESSSAVAELSRVFENELEVSLLRAYDRSGIE